MDTQRQIVNPENMTTIFTEPFEMYAGLLIDNEGKGYFFHNPPIYLQSVEEILSDYSLFIQDPAVDLSNINEFQIIKDTLKSVSPSEQYPEGVIPISSYVNYSYELKGRKEPITMKAAARSKRRRR